MIVVVAAVVSDTLALQLVCHNLISSVVYY